MLNIRLGTVKKQNKQESWSCPQGAFYVAGQVGLTTRQMLEEHCELIENNVSC